MFLFTTIIVVLIIIYDVFYYYWFLAHDSIYAEHVCHMVNQ